MPSKSRKIQSLKKIAKTYPKKKALEHLSAMFSMSLIANQELPPAELERNADFYSWCSKLLKKVLA